jgi:hypothetical protein
MAINEVVRDIENNPSRTKTVTLDLQKIVPLDNQGDEAYVLNSTSTATKIGGGTASPIFVREYKVGYCQSSGFKNSPFNISGTNNSLKVSIDGSTARTVTLASGNGLSGDDLARDLQAKINALAGTGQLEANNLAFLNATVEFINNRFRILSGSISNTYTGVGKSSVDVVAGDSNNATLTLGFDKKTYSESMAGKQATETILSAGYTSGGPTLTVESTTGLAAGYAFSIFDGTNREYFVASGVGSNSIDIVGSGGLTFSYSGGAVVQRIFERDPIADVASPLDNVDSIVRFSLRAIANQLDFSI